jgi:hypothetical protein
MNLNLLKEDMLKADVNWKRRKRVLATKDN